MDIYRTVGAVQIRKQDPLKQGLKRCRMNAVNISIQHSKARSTKTRIETLHSDRNGGYGSIRKQDPLKQGLKRQSNKSFN